MLQSKLDIVPGDRYLSREENETGEELIKSALVAVEAQISRADTVFWGSCLDSQDRQGDSTLIRRDVRNLEQERGWCRSILNFSRCQKPE